MGFPVKGWTSNRLVHLDDGPLGRMRTELKTAFRLGVSTELEVMHTAHDTMNENKPLDVFCEHTEDWMRDKYNAYNVHK
jgi:hypothetical protein